MRLDMVFEGGGAKGMVFVGALQALEAGGHTAGRLIGTSAGAITATLLAVGYDAAEMEQALNERDADGNPLFAGFMDAPTADDFSEIDIDESLTMKLLRSVDIPLVPDWLENKVDQQLIHRLLKLKVYPIVFSFVEKGGLYAGNAFRDWMVQKLEAKGAGIGTMTLEQLHAATGADLSLVASDTTKGEMLVLNHRTAPACPVADAARMSMSIPFAYQEVIWKAEWGGYRETGEGGAVETSDLSGHTIVDGGVLSNFPLKLLISDDPSVRRVMGDTPPDRERVLGLLIDEDLPVAGAPARVEEAEDEERGLAGEFKKLRTVQRVSRLVDTMRSGHDQGVIDANPDLICRLPAQGYGTMEFDMSEARKERLVAAGRAAMEEHLAGH